MYSETLSKESNNAVNLLKIAKDLIVTHGWGQRAFNQVVRVGDLWKRCNYCMLGALHDSDRSIEISDGSFRMAYHSLLSCCGKNLILYNDEDGRTKEEVLDVFDRAIAKIKTDKAHAPTDT